MIAAAAFFAFVAAAGLVMLGILVTDPVRDRRLAVTNHRTPGSGVSARAASASPASAPAGSTATPSATGRRQRRLPARAGETLQLKSCRPGAWPGPHELL